MHLSPPRASSPVAIAIAAMTIAAACTVAACGEEQIRAKDSSQGGEAGGVVPAIPPVWHLPEPGTAPETPVIDFAEAAQADAWLRHPILGDPSFDSFQRARSNPLVRGEAPFRWPVNVFLFEDPASRGWYAFVGNYLEGYDLGPGRPPSHCRVWRSADRGESWELLGPVFAEAPFRFEGDASPANVAPDVSVVHHEGRYHMAYDWATDDTTWETAAAPRGGADGGVAYAVAERPEGPYLRAPRPILRTSEFQRMFPGGTRYRRPYASVLVRRRSDWLVLVDVDSGPHFAWGQVAMTAEDPRGPWSRPVLVSGLEGDDHAPSPVEAFPAFVHEGHVYDPRTSVGANRNFQVIWRAPVEEAHSPEAWQLWQHGTAWHSEPIPHEGFGIWGQTYSGFVDASGTFHVAFPSRHWPGGEGTINLASRPWAVPLRERGFVLSAHSGPSITVLRVAYESFELRADLALRGNSARIAWGFEAPLAVTGRAGGSPDPIVRTRQRALEISERRWRLVAAGEAAEPRVIAEGDVATSPKRSVSIAVGVAGATEIAVDGTHVWSGEVEAPRGPLALLLDAGTHLAVERFAVSGRPAPATWTFLSSEAIAGAGVSESEYRPSRSPAFRFGTGAICTSVGARVKWNFRGRGFRLWLPRGPEWGTCAVRLDGNPLGEIDLRAAQVEGSRVRLERTGLADGYHALGIVGQDGPLPVDCLDALQ